MHQPVTAKSDAYGVCLLRHLDALAACSALEGPPARRSPSPAHLAGDRQVATCIQAAGVQVWADAWAKRRLDRRLAGKSTS